MEVASLIFSLICLVAAMALALRKDGQKDPPLVKVRVDQRR